MAGDDDAQTDSDKPASGPQTKTQIQAVLDRAGSHPRHRFGQNFMVEPNLVRRIAGAGEIEPGDTVLEIGPGTGTLTGELLNRAGHVVAVEIDRDLAAALREDRAREIAGGRLTLVESDALAGKHALAPPLAEAITNAAGPVKLVANLPYNIASPLVIELLIAGVQLLAFTVQKEVADRFAATPASGKAYGPLSVVAHSLADVEVLRTIPPAAFWPRPKIDSALVRLRRDVKLASGEEAAAFARFVGELFAQRRKVLRGRLKTLGINESAAEKIGVHSGDRIETVDAATVRKLYELRAR